MRLRYLQALRGVMETGTVTEAARRLGRTQPQVSRLLGALEAELGFALFIRKGRRLLPTSEGTAFYQQAERILSGWDDIATIAEDIRTRREPKLRLITQPYLAHALMPATLAAFVARHPSFRWALEIRSRGVGDWIAGQQVDLGLAALPLEQPGVRSRPFANATVVAVLPAGHRLARRRAIEAADLAREPYIALKPYTLLRSMADALFARLGLAPDIRAETSSGQSACQAVAQGLGFTIADPLVARSLPKDSVAIRPLRPALKLTYGFLFSAAHEPSALALDFVATAAATAVRLAPAEVKALRLGPAPYAASAQIGGARFSA
jgi:DNA-binding transcriptional LysR family regulator